MSSDDIDSVGIEPKQIEPKGPSRLWIIPASIALHLVIAGLYFVQWPQLPLNVPDENVVQLQLVPEPEPEKPEEAQESPLPPQDEAAEEETQQLSVLPDIAIRPDATRMDAIDGDGAKPSKTENTPAATQLPVEPAPVEEEPRISENPEATSTEGELPAGEAAPVPEEKPAEVDKANQKEQEEREPLSNDSIEGTGLRQMMGDLPPRRRLSQICSIEALAQIKATNSDYARVVGLIPYSDTGGLFEPGKLTASGGAFNLGGRWVNVDFTCEVDLERFRVTKFSQRIGRELSRDEAKARGFTKYE